MSSKYETVFWDRVYGVNTRYEPHFYLSKEARRTINPHRSDDDSNLFHPNSFPAPYRFYPADLGGIALSLERSNSKCAGEWACVKKQAMIRTLNPNLTTALHLLGGLTLHSPGSVLERTQKSIDELGYQIHRASTKEKFSMDFTKVFDPIKTIREATLRDLRKSIDPDAPEMVRWQNTFDLLRRAIDTDPNVDVLGTFFPSAGYPGSEIDPWGHRSIECPVTPSRVLEEHPDGYVEVPAGSRQEEEELRRLDLAKLTLSKRGSTRRKSHEGHRTHGRGMTHGSHLMIEGSQNQPLRKYLTRTDELERDLDHNNSVQIRGMGDYSRGPEHDDDAYYHSGDDGSHSTGGYGPRFDDRYLLNSASQAQTMVSTPGYTDPSYYDQNFYPYTYQDERPLPSEPMADIPSIDDRRVTMRRGTRSKYDPQNSYPLSAGGESGQAEEEISRVGRRIRLRPGETRDRISYSQY